MLHVDKTFDSRWSPTDGVGVRGNELSSGGLRRTAGLHLPGFCGTAKFVGCPKLALAALPFWNFGLTLHNVSTNTQFTISPGNLIAFTLPARNVVVPPLRNVGPSLTNWDKSTRTSAARRFLLASCLIIRLRWRFEVRIGPYRCI